MPTGLCLLLFTLFDLKATEERKYNFQFNIALTTPDSTELKPTLGRLSFPINRRADHTVLLAEACITPYGSRGYDAIACLLLLLCKAFQRVSSGCSGRRTRSSDWFLLFLVPFARVVQPQPHIRFQSSLHSINYRHLGPYIVLVWSLQDYVALLENISSTASKLNIGSRTGTISLVFYRRRYISDPSLLKDTGLRLTPLIA